MKRLFVTVCLLLAMLGSSATEKSSTIVYINGAKYYIHTVQPGETIYALSKAYGIGEKVILENNPTASSGLKAASSLKIPYVGQVRESMSEKKLARIFNFHYVVKGETLFAISRQFEIPVNTIIEDNPGIDPIHLRLGERILIRRKQVGSEDEAGSREQWEEYRQTLNSVAESGTSYHLVQAGETFYSLARQFKTTEKELERLNNGLQAADLKAGTILKVPGDAIAIPATTDQTETADPSAQIEQSDTAQVDKIEFRALRSEELLHVALLLPFSVEGDANNNYLEFYQGFLLGLDSVKVQRGVSVHVEVFNTARNPKKIEEITQNEAFRQAQLIVGPVYEEAMQPVVRYAEEHRIPVVSPLANLTQTRSEVMFQLAPDPASKYDKVSDLLAEDKQITLIYGESTDKEFEREMLTLLNGKSYAKHTYKYVHPSSGKSAANSPSDLSPLLENSDNNVFIILADKEVDVDRILAALASANTSIVSRGRFTPQFTVLGNARWNRYNNIDRTMFFKDRITFVSTYHAKRNDLAIANFDSAYIRAFGALPTLYSYRGYDTALIFAPAMYGDIEYNLEGRRFTPLQTTYTFSQEQVGDNHVNTNWTRVNYLNDFTITIE